jgi:hypothetical protein
MNRFIGTSAMPLCLLLSACGGDGTSVASIPQPPPVTPTATPTPTPSAALAADAFPISHVGVHDLMGMENWTGPVTPGTFSLNVSKPAGDQVYSYSVTAPPGFLPGGLTSIEFGPSNFLELNDSGRGSYSKTLPWNATDNFRTGFAFDAGYSYVSMGEWSWAFVHLDGGSAEDGGGEFLFVTGDHTPSAGIPVSGTATYDAHTFALLSSSLTTGIPFTLTADFGQRTISTQIDQDYRYISSNADLLDDPVPAIHVSGSAPFSNSGSFDIPLTGTASEHSYNVPTPPPLASVTGDMNGAFFGPNAEQVGGTFVLRRMTDQVPLYGDAFVGQQHH